MLTALRKLVNKKHLSPQQIVGMHCRTQRVFKHTIKPFLQPLHITLIDWEVLELLSEKEDGQRFNSLAKELKIEASFATEIIQKLVKKRLVIIAADVSDKRAKIIKLTDKGHEIKKQIDVVIQEHASRLFGEVTSSEYQGYSQMIEKILKSN